jgi:hypothetical protein
MDWLWHDVAPEDFKNQSFEDIGYRYRQSGPVGLLTRSAACPEVVVVNLLAPKGSVFWGCTWSPSFPHARSLAARPSQEMKNISSKASSELLRRAGISRQGTQARWFEACTEAAGKGPNTVVSLSRDGMYLENWRWFNTAIQVKDLKSLQELLSCQVKEFGALSFWNCDERVSFRGGGMGVNSALDARLAGLGSYEFQLALEAPDTFLSLAAMAIAESERSVALLSDRRCFDFALSSEILVKPPNLNLIPDTWNVLGEVRESHEKLVRLRAQLVRGLKWPSHYLAALNSVRPVVGQPSMKSVPELAEAHQNLTLYLNEMQHEYPVLVSMYPFVS